MIEYIVNKYQGRAAQTLTLGRYKIANLINDLCKVCGVEEKGVNERIKNLLKNYCNELEFVIDGKIYQDKELNLLNKKYDNIISHFIKMFGKVRYFGTHASSVILSNEPIEECAGLIRVSNNLRTSFDLKDIGSLKLLKLDILGLASVTKVKELEELTGIKFSYEMLEDEGMLEKFNTDVDGSVFQFESKSSMDIARRIKINSFEDVVVATSLNRPGPLKLSMHEKYAEAKENPNENALWYKYTQNTYGVIIYQEQGMRICRGIGELDWETTDTLVKADYTHLSTEQMDEWRKLFVPNAIKNGLNKKEAEDLYESLLHYSFNRGHGVAYAMTSAILMWYKKYYPLYFWYVTLKNTYSQDSIFKHKKGIVHDGIVLFLPHVNGTAEVSIKKFDDDYVIQEGLNGIKNIGDKAAYIIEAERKKNGPYKSIDDLISRVPKQSVNKRFLDALKEHGALEFNKKTYINRVMKYNSALYSR